MESHRFPAPITILSGFLGAGKRASGAGNPSNPNGLKTDCLWKEVLMRAPDEDG